MKYRVRDCKCHPRLCCWTLLQPPRSLQIVLSAWCWASFRRGAELCQNLRIANRRCPSLLLPPHHLRTHILRDILSCDAFQRAFEYRDSLAAPFVSSHGVSLQPEALKLPIFGPRAVRNTNGTGATYRGCNLISRATTATTATRATRTASLTYQKPKTISRSITALPFRNRNSPGLQRLGLASLIMAPSERILTVTTRACTL